MRFAPVGAWLTMALVSMASRAGTDDAAKNLQQFLDANFPTQAFIATPFGADSRFGPPTIWIKLTHAQGNPRLWSNGKKDAWVAFSDGSALYSQEYVPLHIENVDLVQLKREKSHDWSIAASLAASVEGVDVDETIKLARAKGLEVQVSTGEAQVVYGYYGDFIVAQEVNKAILDRMNTALRARFKEKIPQRRVVVAALRVRKANFALKETSSFNLEAEADLTEKLGKLGFKWNSSAKEFQNLGIGGEWRYIGFQSLLTDEGGKISTANDSPGATDFAFSSEIPWQFPEGAEIPE